VQTKHAGEFRPRSIRNEACDGAGVREGTVLVEHLHDSNETASPYLITPMFHRVPVQDGRRPGGADWPHSQG